jgi:ATP-dependent exoDNAse (exonuclease V), alpha subunit - helicase superfamily I member
MLPSLLFTSNVKGTAAPAIETVPLRVCVAITIYKSQGITVGKGEQFEHVVVHLPLNSKRVVPGLELVAFSRAKSLDCSW